ncbi:MAG: universal stress protein, partial [Nitrospirales bacterium]|nr:universal stress protein [Nitrospirales bacterium]
GSEQSHKAARFLTSLALTPEDEVLILHVISDVPFMDDTEAYSFNFSRIKKEIAPAILESAREKLSGIPASITVTVAEGNPSQLIPDIAKNSGCGLILLGSHGLKGISSLLLGSTARSVAIASPLPVLVVKPLIDLKTGPIRILFATDGSEEAEETARLLTSLPFPSGSKVTVLTVITSFYKDIPERYWMEVNERVQKEITLVTEKELAVADRIVQNAIDILRPCFSGMEASIRMGDPSLTILDTAQETEADLIAVGSRGVRGIQGLLGSVSRNVIGHSDCSVLVGKGGQ